MKIKELCKKKYTLTEKEKSSEVNEHTASELILGHNTALHYYYCLLSQLMGMRYRHNATIMTIISFGMRSELVIIYLIFRLVLIMSRYSKKPQIAQNSKFITIH